MAEAPPLLPSTSTSLLAQIKDQDAEAWRRLANIYGPTVYRWARKAGLQPADAADILQEVFQAVARRIGQFQHDSGDSFRAWLWTIYHSKLMDLYRRRKVEQGDRSLDAMPVTELLDNSRPGDDASELETARLVQRALAVIRIDFQENVWQAFWRSTVLNHRTRDIAAALSMQPAAVCMARARVLTRLRETLAEMGILGDDAEG